MNTISLKYLVFSIFLVFLFQQCYGLDQPENLIKNFSYNKELSFEPTQRVYEDIETPKANINYITFKATQDRKVRALLVQPKKSGKHSGIIWMHWLGPRNSDFNEFLDEAIILAEKGTISLLPMGYLPFQEVQKGSAGDTNLIINQMTDLQRSLDFLLQQEGIDSNRIGLVGHDYGGMSGAILSGIDQRIHFFVFMTITPSYSDWASYFYQTTPEKTSNYMNLISNFEPVFWIKNKGTKPVFFQFSRSDQYIPEKKALEIFDACPVPKDIRWYKSGHELDEEARKDRIEWIIRNLNDKEIMNKR